MAPPASSAALAPLPVTTRRRRPSPATAGLATLLALAVLAGAGCSSGTASGEGGSAPSGPGAGGGGQTGGGSGGGQTGGGSGSGGSTGASTGPVPISVPGRVIYVDADTGDDQREGTSPATAVRTLAAGVQRLARSGGDKLVLRGVFAESLLLNDFVAPASPTVVQCAFDSEGKPLEARIDGGLSTAASFPFDQGNLPSGFGPGTGNYLATGISISHSSNVVISGIGVRGIAGVGLLGWRSSQLRLEHLDIEWTARSAMLVSHGNPGEPPIHDVTIAHCRINQSNLGLWVNQATQSGYTMTAESLSLSACDGFEVYGNHISNSLMEGIDFKSGSRNGSVHHNLVENTRSVGIYVNEAEDSDVYRNIVRRTGYYDPQDGSGLGLAQAYLAQKLPALFGPVETGSTGIALGNGDLGGPQNETGRCRGIRVYENVVCWTRKSGIAVWNEWRVEGRTGWVLEDIHVYNNVVHGTCLGPRIAPAAILVDVGLSNGSVRNNLITDSAEVAIDIWEPTAGSFFATSAISHNLMWNNRSGGVEGTSSLQAAPLYVQPPAAVQEDGDFRLQAGSPAIDSGYNTGVESGGTATDRGAYQHGLAPWTAGR